MDEFLKNEFRLIQCYRAYPDADEATEKCSKYAEQMKQFVSDGGLELKNIMKEYWKQFYKTRNYYIVTKP
jgi:hypothetical protein